MLLTECSESAAEYPARGGTAGRENPSNVSAPAVDRSVSVLYFDTYRTDPLRKTYRLDSIDQGGNVRFSAGLEAGAWHSGEKPSPSTGKWTELAVAQFKHHYGDDKQIACLEDWAPFLTEYAGKHQNCLVQGRLHDDRRTGQTFSAGRSVANHSKVYYEDYARRWMLIDLDGLPVDYDVTQASQQDIEQSIDEHLADVLPDFADCSYVASFTGSAGIKSGLRVRLVLELDTPLTLRQQKRLLVAAKKGAVAAGEAFHFDTGIYDPARLIFTSAPRLFARIDQADFHQPRPVSSNAWFVERDNDTVVVAPAATITDSDSVKELLDDGEIAGTKAELPELLAGIGTGDSPYHMPILRIIGSVAARTPASQMESALPRTMAAVRKRIVETSAPHKRDERLAKHLDAEWWRTEWQRTLEWKREQAKGKAAAIAPPSAPAAVVPTAAPATIADARKQLADKMADAARDLIEQRSSTHYLVKAAPGMGKTLALKAVVTEALLANKRARIYVPTHALAAQLVADLQAHARTLPLTSTFTSEQLAARVRHHKGRRQPGMCADDVHGKLADRAEQLGQSPKKHVCSVCPVGRAGQCSWLLQTKDDGPGVIVQAHANLARDIDPSTDATDLYVIDEGAEGTFVGANAGKLCLPDLNPGNHAVRRRRRKSDVYSRGVDFKASAELERYRLLLIDALRSAMPVVRGEPGVLLVDATSSMQQDVSWTERRDERPVDCSGPLIGRAIAMEEQHRLALVSEVTRSQVDNDFTRELTRQFTLSLEATRIFEAIKASVDTKRPAVFGLRVYWQRKDGQRIEYISVEQRRDVPAAIRAKGAIWLDGTAVDDVWRAVISPDGSPFPHRVIAADAPIGAVDAAQYPDRRYSRQMLAPDMANATDSELADDIDAEANARAWMAAAPWIRSAGLDPDAEATRVATLRTQAAVVRQRAVQRKLRADSNLARLWRFILIKALPMVGRYQQAARNGGDTSRHTVLVVAQKAIEDELRALGLPDNVAVAHFGALRGLNAYRNVSVAIVFGRPALANAQLEMLTEALHMHNPAVQSVERATTWHEADDVVATALGLEPIKTEVHPDPHCRALGQALAPAEVRQAVARIRPYDRGPSNPCELHVFGQHQAGVPIKSLGTWEDAEFGWHQVALANGCLFERPETNQQIYIGLVPQKGRSGDGAGEQRDAWVDVLCAGHKALAKCGPISNSKYRNDESTFPNRDQPTIQPELIPGTEHALCSFALAPTPDNPRPYQQYAVLRPSVGKAGLERLTGRQVAKFDWLPAADVTRLLEKALDKALRQRAGGGGTAAADYEAAYAQAVLSKQADGWTWARAVLGWPI